MDRLDELAVLVAIQEAGSLAAAARRLRRSAPAITRVLAALEERVGARLVERTTRRIAFTETGRQLAQQARAVLAGYAEAVRAADATPLRGVIRVTAPVVFGRRHVAPLIAGFLAGHAQVQIELVLADHNLDLIEERLDAAVRIGPLTEASLIARRVGEVRRLLVASPGYIAARGAPERASALAGHDTIFTASREAPVQWRLYDRGRTRSVRLTPRLIVNDVEAALAAARAGLGIASALSYQVADDFLGGGLMRLLPECEPPPLPVHLVSSGTHHRASRVRAFLDYAAERLTRLDVIGRL